VTNLARVFAPKIWYDASDTNYNIYSWTNNLVAGWNDSSGNGFDARSTNQPTFLTNVTIGIPGLTRACYQFTDFSGTNGTFLTNQYSHLDQTWTVFFVVNISANTNLGSDMLEFNDGGGGAGNEIIASTVPGTQQMRAAVNAQNAYVNNLSGWSICGAMLDIQAGISTNLFVFGPNGYDNELNPLPITGYGGMSIINMFIGKSKTFPEKAYGGRMAEIIYWPQSIGFANTGLSGRGVPEVLSYLRWKYNLN
jgi:hypothetical protein